MTKSFKYIFGGVFVVVAIILGLRLLSGDEDTWLCTSAGWVKHGNPSAPMPDTNNCPIQ